MPLTNPSTQTTRISNSKTTDANNTTANIQLFRITGSIRVVKLLAHVTTTMGANHTGGFFRLNDQTAQVDITASAGGSTLSAAAVGTILMKSGLAAAIGTVKTSAAGRVTEPTALETVYFSECVLTAKNGANTDIEYRYTTTDTPTSGQLNFIMEYEPLSADASVTAL